MVGDLVAEPRSRLYSLHLYLGVNDWEEPDFMNDRPADSPDADKLMASG